MKLLLGPLHLIMVLPVALPFPRKLRLRVALDFIARGGSLLPELSPLSFSAFPPDSIFSIPIVR